MLSKLDLLTGLNVPWKFQTLKKYYMEHIVITLPHSLINHLYNQSGIPDYIIKHTSLNTNIALKMWQTFLNNTGI